MPVTDIVHTKKSDMESVITVSNENNELSMKNSLVELPLEVRIVNIYNDIKISCAFDYEAYDLECY